MRMLRIAGIFVGSPLEVGAVVVHVVELEHDGVGDVLHRDVGVAHIFDKAAGAAHGFDADAVVGAVEGAVADKHVVDCRRWSRNRWRCRGRA